MALPGIGNSISFRQIRDEFGLSPGRSLGGYRISDEIEGSGLTLPLDDGIPTSGTIKFSDFRGKRLNVVVDCFSGNEDEFHVNAKTDKWNSGDTIVVGRLTDRKEQGSKIRIAVNKKFGSATENSNQCALRTGSWDATAQVVVDVSANGRLLGAGGKGGDGADGISNNGESGGDGTSALGIEKNNTVVNVYTGGIIRAGFGGGGGGGGGRETSKNDRRAGGGGGGGGAGFPIGLGGRGGDPPAGTDNNGSSIGSDGDDATETSKGFGKAGGDNEDQAFGGRGGNGADNEETTAEDGVSRVGTGDGGTAEGLKGSNGAAIRTSTGSVSFTFGVNNGTVTGSTSATGVD